MTGFRQYLSDLVYSGAVERLSAPTQVSLDITRACNLKCVYCYAEAPHAPRSTQELTTAELSRLIAHLGEIGVMELVIGGGEPFLRRDLLALLKEAKDVGLSIYLISNGTAITARKAAALRSVLDGGDTIQISVDGPTAEVHESLRGVSGAFARTAAGLRHLAGGPYSLIANQVVTRRNHAFVERSLDFCASIGVDLRLLRMQYLGDAESSSDLALDAPGERALYATINRRNAACGADEARFIDIPAAVHWTSLLGSEPAENIAPGPRANVVCPAGTTGASVDHEGNVFACTFFNGFAETRLGSIREQSFLDIWEHSEGWRTFRHPPPVEGKCQTCGFAARCASGCFATSYAQTGRMTTPDPLCRL